MLDRDLKYRDWRRGFTNLVFYVIAITSTIIVLYGVYNVQDASTKRKIIGASAMIFAIAVLTVPTIVYTHPKRIPVIDEELYGLRAYTALATTFIATSTLLL